MTEKQAWLCIAKAFDAPDSRHGGLSSWGLCYAVHELLISRRVSWEMAFSMREKIALLPRGKYWRRGSPFVWRLGDRKSRAAAAREFAKQCGPRQQKSKSKSKSKTKL